MQRRRSVDRCNPMSDTDAFRDLTLKSLNKWSD